MSVSVCKTPLCMLGEGPHWEDASQTLLYVDSHRGEIHRYNDVTGQDINIKLEGRIGHVIPRESGGYVAGLDQSLVAVDWDTQEVTSLAEVDQGKKTRINDGKCDPSGRLWAGTMNAGHTLAEISSGSGCGLYSLETDGSTCTLRQPGVTLSNGLTWSTDQATMFYVDSIPRQLYAYNFDINTGNISERRVLLDLSDTPIEEFGYPDGVTTDVDDNLWLALSGAGKVIQVDPRTGQIKRSVKFPVPYTTSCCLGGARYDELYVTSLSSRALGQDSNNTLEGSTFKVTGLGVKGQPADVYRG